MAVVKDGQSVNRRDHPRRRAHLRAHERAVAEPVVYMMDRYVVGGFYRMHAERGVDENLNAPGSSFVPLALCPERANAPARACKPGASAPNRFYMYGVMAAWPCWRPATSWKPPTPNAEVYDLMHQCTVGRAATKWPCTPGSNGYFALR